MRGSSGGADAEKQSAASTEATAAAFFTLNPAETELLYQIEFDGLHHLLSTEREQLPGQRAARVAASRPSFDRSTARHRYQAAVVRYGAQRRPKAASAFGAGRLRLPYASR